MGKCGFDQQGWYGMFVACGIWCLADVSSVSPSSEQTHGQMVCILRVCCSGKNTNWTVILLRRIMKSFRILADEAARVRLFSTWFSFVTQSLCYGSISWHVRKITSVLQKNMNTKIGNRRDLKDRYSHRSSSLNTGMEDGSSCVSTIKLLELRSELREKEADE